MVFCKTSSDQMLRTVDIYSRHGKEHFLNKMSADNKKNSQNIILHRNIPCSMILLTLGFWTFFAAYHVCQRGKNHWEQGFDFNLVVKVSSCYCYLTLLSNSAKFYKLLSKNEKSHEMEVVNPAITNST